MGFMDLIRELRTSKPDARKAARVMKYIGWACLVGGLWNFILPQVAPFPEGGFRLPGSYPYAALIIFSIIGALFLLAARGIQGLNPRGCTIGQVAIVALFLSAAGFMAWMPSMIHLPGQKGFFPTMFYIVTAIASVQFGLPAYFGFRYLGRLAESPASTTATQEPAMLPRPASAPFPARREVSYKDSSFPFGIVGTFVPMIVVLVLGTFVAQQFAGPEIVAMYFASMFLFVFIGPTIFNYRTSPFQRSRRFIAAFTGGGSIFLFHGSWPFFRLLVYQDALEVRVMFHRFLIPFDKMDDIPDSVGFFSSGILIRSDLPDVPSSIRFSGFGMKKIVQTVCDARKAYLRKAG